MKYYKIKKINLTSYKCIIFSVGYISPTEELINISKDLKKKNIKGKIIFDLLLSKGNLKNRYIELFFDGKKFDYNSLNKIDINKCEKKIINISNDFYQKKYNLIESSQILTKSIKLFLKNNLNKQFSFAK